MFRLLEVYIHCFMFSLKMASKSRYIYSHSFQIHRKPLATILRYKYGFEVSCL